MSNEEWERFVEQEIARRFPLGFTNFSGKGRWRHSSGKFVTDTCEWVLIFCELNSSADVEIEAIRTSYKQKFGLESVLRADSSARISF